MVPSGAISQRPAVCGNLLRRATSNLAGNAEKPPMSEPHAKPKDAPNEAELIARAIRGDQTAVRVIIQRNNRRLYRIARSVLKDESEAEDAVQEAYIQAFAALSKFRGQASLSTWLSRIVLNEALQRLRHRRDVNLELAEISSNEAQVIPFPSSSYCVDPERAAAQRELNRLIEREIDKLPEAFRLVLVARVIEDMSIEETAELLDVRPETVKTRLHRARGLLKAAFAEHAGALFSDLFPFAGARCEHMIAAVLERLGHAA
jgi:RNA polymerase sigma-70 factor, ECF subfamily